MYSVVKVCSYMAYEARGNRAEILKLLMRRFVVECRRRSSFNSNVKYECDYICEP